ncbi:MAG: phosphocholine cytidylyltransferase family protein [Sphingobium limneticum]
MNVPFERPVDQDAGNATELLRALPERRDVRKAVILAAGRGRRMAKLTADRPKGALEVAGHALIDWQIEALRAAGVSDIAIVTGHGAAALAGRDVTYIHNADWKNGTQVETLLKAAAWVGDDPIIVTYSDIIFHPSAPLALLERPGEIVIAYDADHRWLWQKRFGDWLKDSETFRLGPGQVLAEIGGKPTDIEALDGQFMGLMLFSSTGQALLKERFLALEPERRRKCDFTSLLQLLIDAGVRIDTACNALPWIEIDNKKDLALAQSMARRDSARGITARIMYPPDLPPTFRNDATDDPLALALQADDLGEPMASESEEGDFIHRYSTIRDYSVDNFLAIQNWGRSGSTFVQSLFDDHPQILSTPNFYSRHFYRAWAATISRKEDSRKIDSFLEAFEQLYNPGLVDVTAGLNRLGPNRDQVAGVSRADFERYLRAALPSGTPITRRQLFVSAHLAYALARSQRIEAGELTILYPIHGSPRAVAAAVLEDFPEAKFLHTIREPVANLASSIQHYRKNMLDERIDPLEATIVALFDERTSSTGSVSTQYSIRPYFSWLIASDQCRALKLEDVHCQAASTLARLARWVAITEHDVLFLSTWDGLKWWNRPESGNDSALGNTSLDRNIEAVLTKQDQEKVRVLAANSTLLVAAYGPSRPSPQLISIAMRFLAAFIPFKAESEARKTRWRCLRGLARISWALPKSVSDEIRTTFARENHRALLIEMAAGAIEIRRRLPIEQRLRPLRATLVLTPTGKGWRTRALFSLGDREKPAVDQVDALFLRDSSRIIDTSHQSFWLFVAFVGGSIERISTFFRIRRLMLKQVWPFMRARAQQERNMELIA